MISQVDFPATLSALCNQAWDSRSGPDSQDQLAALLGEKSAGRSSVVLHAGGTAVRAGHWKYIPPGRTRDGLGPWRSLEVAAPGLLFDLNRDPGETTDLAALHPERLAELKQLHSALTAPTARNGAMP